MQLSGRQAYFIGWIRANGLGLINLAQTMDSEAYNLKLGGLSEYHTHTHTFILEVMITSQKDIELYVVLIKGYWTIKRLKLVYPSFQMSQYFIKICY